MFRYNRSMLLALYSLAGMASASLAHAVTYDAANDFSIASNPNGVWQYGYTTSLGSAFVQDTNQLIQTQFDAWEGALSGAGIYRYPIISHNNTNTNVATGTVRYQPGQMVMHPGPDGEYSDLRWTAPVTGTFTLNAGFIGQDVDGTTSDVHILKNGVSLFSNNINGYQDAKSYSAPLSFTQGDVVDVAVGYGSNKTYNFDSTGVSLTLSSPSTTPAPSSLLVTLVGGVPGVILLRRRK